MIGTNVSTKGSYHNMAKKAARPRLGAGGAAPQNSRQAARQNLAAATTGKGGAAEQNLTTAQGLLPIQPKKQKGRRHTTTRAPTSCPWIS